MKKTTYILALVLALVASGAIAAVVAVPDAEVPEAPTFHRDVEPILQANCQTCHRPKPLEIAGMIAPFSLTSYKDARPWAKSIARAVESKAMPPWFATEKFHGVFRNERSLTDPEIETIVRWVRNGAPKGDPALAPPPVEFSSEEWWLGEPDLIVKLPEPVWVGDDVVDWQPNINIVLTEEQLPEGRYLRAVECKPGSDVVHHIVINAMGDSGGGDDLSRAVGKLIGGLAPGDEPSMIQDGYGARLEPGTTLRVNMHYNKEAGPGTGVYDQSVLGFHFWPRDAVVREVVNAPIGLLDFEIPPHQMRHKVGMARTFERPFTVLSMLPHMHVRGVASEINAFYPDGSSEQLLDVPNYDYNWQISYEYPEPRSFPAGTRIEVTMEYDNSEENPSNPDPDKAINFGLKTQDEMALGFIQWAWDDVEATSIAATGGGDE